MKTALAIVCSLVLVWANLISARTPDASVATATASCHCGMKTGCCAAKRSLPEPPPVSAAPTFSFQNNFSFIAPAIVTWSLPESPARELPGSTSSSFRSTGASLFARDCAWLI